MAREAIVRVAEKSAELDFSHQSYYMIVIDVHRRGKQRLGGSGFGPFEKEKSYLLPMGVPVLQFLDYLDLPEYRNVFFYQVVPSTIDSWLHALSHIEQFSFDGRETAVLIVRIECSASVEAVMEDV